VTEVGAPLEEFLKIDSLKPDLQNLNLIVKIVNVGPSRAIPSKSGHRQVLVAEALAGDETGSVVLTLWEDQINRFKVNDVIEIRQGYTNIFKGSLRLNIGRTGRVEKVDRKIDKVNTRNNLSEKTYVQIPWHLSETRPFRSRRRSRRR